MIELVSPDLVAADDARLGWTAGVGPEMSASRWAGLARALQMPESALRETFRSSPDELRERARRHAPATTLRYAACLAEALLDDTLNLARTRKSQDKVLLAHQAVALRVANLYLALLGLEQLLDDSIAKGGVDSAVTTPCSVATPTSALEGARSGAAMASSRRRHAAELLLSVLRNAAQVLAGHGFVDNPRFEALHQSALDTVRDLHVGDWNE